METERYILIESSFLSNGVRNTTYGIAYTDFSNGIPVILKAIPDLSTNKDRVQYLAVLCTELQLSPLHLRDVIDDFLAE
ncbi:MAG: hypothetical protein E7623_02910 [Ruminococcaceae bacterium]|nr:hypothetical protein [Oscillospiraceae bacterium]